jgi:maleamate amidohydrolase
VGFGQRPALLLVDNWKVMLGEEPLPVREAVARWPRSLGEPAWRAVAHTEQLLAKVRERSWPVIHTTMLTGPFAASDWFSATRAPHAAVESLPPTPTTTNPFEIVPELQPIEGEVLIEKTGPSAFWGTPLISVLQQHDVDTLLVCGESTSGCVRATVVDAATHGFRTVVVEECVYDRHQACHAINLFDMDQKYADVLSLDQVLQWIEAQEMAGGTSSGGSR